MIKPKFRKNAPIRNIPNEITFIQEYVGRFCATSIFAVLLIIPFSVSGNSERKSTECKLFHLFHFTAGFNALALLILLYIDTKYEIALYQIQSSGNNVALCFVSLENIITLCGFFLYR